MTDTRQNPAERQAHWPPASTPHPDDEPARPDGALPCVDCSTPPEMRGDDCSGCVTTP